MLGSLFRVRDETITLGCKLLWPSLFTYILLIKMPLLCVFTLRMKNLKSMYEQATTIKSSMCQKHVLRIFGFTDGVLRCKTTNKLYNYNLERWYMWLGKLLHESMLQKTLCNIKVFQLVCLAIPICCLVFFVTML